MIVQTYKTTPLETNTYLVVNGERAFVVDPGDGAKTLSSAAERAGATIEAVLLTHGHSDHIGGAAELQRRGALIVMHRDDVELIGSYKNLAFALGAEVDKFVPDVALSGGETVTIAGIEISVVHTPGHTRGGVCFVAENAIFTGDTLFELSYGRTDFPGGSFKELKNSILNKLFALRGDYTLYPGHGDPTSLEFERAHNPINSDND